MRGLTAPWLAERLGVDPIALDVRRRSWELFATRASGTGEWLYPSWQFDEKGEVRSDVARVLAAARDAGLTQGELEAILAQKVGLSGGRTMLDLLIAGEADAVVRSIRARS
jgi:hypothetical protein